MESSYPPPHAPEPFVGTPVRSSLAVVSLVCGILGFVTCGMAGLAGVITGHIALSSIKRSGGMLSGQGMARGGLITGYLSIIFIVIAVMSGLARTVIMAQRHEAERKAKKVEVSGMWLAFSGFNAKYHSFPADGLAPGKAEFSGMSGPHVLQQLEAAGTITDLQTKLEVGKQDKGEWIYFTGATASAFPPVPLLMSPEIGVRYLVLYSNGSVKQQGDSAAVALLSAPHVNIPTPRRL